MKDRDKLVSMNTGLVHACARRFAGRGVDYEDLYSCGCVGLVKAAKKYNESLGFKFSTYAVPVILGEIKQIFRDTGAVKVSRSVKELSLKVSRVTEEYLQKNGSEPSASQVAEILGVSVWEVAEALDAARLPLSLSYKTEEDGREWEPAEESQEEKITERLSLYQVINSLEPSDRELIDMRYFRNMTQTLTAQKMGMTQVQVSRREKKVLAILREKLICE